MTKKILLLLLLLPIVGYGQHTLKANFVPKEDFGWAIMYRVNTTGVLYKKDAKVIEGLFEVALDSTVTPGTYRIVYGLPQERKNFDFLYNGKENIEFSFSEKDGLYFTVSQENILLGKYRYDMSEVQGKINSLYTSDQEDKSELVTLFGMQKEIQEGYEKISKNTLAGTFIKAERPYIATTTEEVNTYAANQRKHHFKEADITSEILQESKYAYNRIVQYLRQKEDLDTAAAWLAPANKEFQKKTLTDIWNTAVEVNRVELANYLAKKFLIPIAETLGDTALVEQLVLFENLSIGAKAPNFSWPEGEKGKEKTQTLHEIEGAKNYVLVFWSSGCSHCLKELPQLQKTIQTLAPEDYKVVAVGLEEEPYGWRNEIDRYPEFKHVLGLGKWENDIGKKYGVSGTPTYFLMNEDKIITAKPDSLEALTELLTAQKTAEK